MKIVLTIYVFFCVFALLCFEAIRRESTRRLREHISDWSLVKKIRTNKMMGVLKLIAICLFPIIHICTIAAMLTKTEDIIEETYQIVMDNIAEIS